MRKLLSMVALLVVAGGVQAQDYCKQIRKEATDSTTFNFETPYNEENPPFIRATRGYSTTPDGEFDNFNLIFVIPCEFGDLITKNKEGMEMEREEFKIEIEFDDKSKLKDDSLAVTHDKKNDGTALRMAYFTVTPENYKSFSTKKITKFKLYTAEQAVDNELATAIQQYVICLKAVKK